MSIPWLDFESIDKTKVLVVGCGATGNEVLKNLVLSGFRNITIVDMDYVELSNLNRCMFFREDDAENKRKKAQVAKERIEMLNPDVKILYHTKRIQDLPEDFIPSHDLVLGCMDNLESRLHVNAFCYHNEIPYIDCATRGFSGKVQVILPPKTPCFECTLNRSHMKILERRYSCSGEDTTYIENPLPAEITTTSVVAAVSVREGLKIASKSPDVMINKLYHYNGEKNISELIEIGISPNCRNHEK
jgi:molybdopterin/thiamine biosynthesis adenylyltransferase